MLPTRRRGIGFARPGNRFWPAAVRPGPGLAEVDRDPRVLLPGTTAWG